ncbi:MAG: phage tail tube protein [Lamprocystis purpurea]|jgi:hypothetical protein|nr:phage tail tube protein [Lamprocystis purpurea]
MANGYQTSGRFWVYVNGTLLRAKTGITVAGIGGTSRKAVVGAQVWGFSEETVAPSVEGTLADTADLSLIALNQITDATVTVELDTGKTYVLRHAWCESAVDLQDGDGGVKVKFGGMSIEEQL